MPDTSPCDIRLELLKLATEGVKKVVVKLGDHAPVIVCDDGDVDAEATMMARAKFRAAGHACISLTRLYIQHAEMRLRQLVGTKADGVFESAWLRHRDQGQANQARCKAYDAAFS